MIFVRFEIRSDHDAVTEFSARQCVLRLLTVSDSGKFDENFAASGDLDSRNRSWDFHGSYGSELAAFLPDVLQDLFVLLLVPELFGGDHIEEAQHLGGSPGTGDAAHARNLEKRHV